MDSSAFQRKNVVVTGGAGFIGSHLCEELVATCNVICIDNFVTGSEDNIHHLLSSPHFKFLRHDVTVPISLESFPELKVFQVGVQGIQEVYNLACPTSPRQYQEHQVETLLANALGTKNTLDLAVRYKAKLLHLSSSAIYGAPLDDKPFPETYWGFVDPIGPRSSYTEGKRFAESLVQSYVLRFQLEAKILRVFNTYGPRMRLGDGRMLPDFVASALSGEPLVVYGDENSMSTFNYVTDLIEAILKMVASSESGPINIGNPEPVTMKSVAESVIRMTESTSPVTMHEPMPYTVQQGIADITLAKDRLGWFPVVPLEQGLQQTIEHMKGSRVMRLTDVAGGGA